MFNYSNLFADPHYVQALHPYWGNDEIFLEFLNKHKEPVNAVVNKYEGSKDPDDGEDRYIYIYIINKSASTDFLLNIACPGALPYEVYSGIKGRVNQGDIAKIEDVSSDPVRKTPEAEVDSHKNISWKLDPASTAQGMWFYSKSPPAKRSYTLRSTNGPAITGTIDGPACVASDYKERKKSLAEQYRTYCPLKDTWEKEEKIHLINILARRNGCTEEVSIDAFEKSKDKDWNLIFISCDTSSEINRLKFKCKFEKDCQKKCWILR